MAPTCFTACPTLAVPDTAATAHWYRDRLGFEVLGLWGTGYAIVKKGRALIHFAGMPRGHTASFCRPNTGRTSHSDMWDIYLHTDDVDALYTDYRNRGAAIIRPPYDAPHGLREFHISDLNGYMLAFGQD